MKKESVMILTEAIVQVDSLGDNDSTILLQDAMMGMFIKDAISREEFEWMEKMIVQERYGEHNFCDQIIVIDREMADSTIHWLRDHAKEMLPPFDTAVQRAATFLQDFWSTIFESEINSSRDEN